MIESGSAIVGVVVIALVAVVLASLAPSSAHGAPKARPAQGLKRAPLATRSIPGTVSVSVDTGAAIGPVVPADFLGLSFEASSLSSVAAYASSGHFVTLLRSLGPGVMRFGGISADLNTAWLQEGVAPTWATATIAPQNLAALSHLAQATGWRVLLTVNLARYEPAVAAQEAKAAQTLLGSSLAGIAIGNEPDRYVADRLRPAGWSRAAYLSEVNAYRTAIAAAAPGVQIVGPDASSGRSVLPWVTKVAASERPALLTDHYYPLTRCAGHRPKLSSLLSPAMRTDERATLRRLAVIAHTSALPLRLDETNNISCRGQPGVSNAFASALWAVHYVAQAMASGLAGLNFHDLIGEPHTYSPLVATSPQELMSGALHANPEWYALLLASQLLGHRPVQATVTAANPDLTGSAFLGPGGRLQIVLVNFASPGTQQPVVHLHLSRRFGAGTILRLTAPAPSATVGVALGGRSVGPMGVWSPSASLPRVSGGPGSLELHMPPSSAALVTLYPTG